MLKREYVVSGVKVPAYFLSVTARDLDERKMRWERERITGKIQLEPQHNDSTLHQGDKMGLIAKIDSDGVIVNTSPCFMAHGIMVTQDGVLNASHSEIRIYSLNLEQFKNFASFYPFNALHSLRKSRRGVLIASSGTDSIIELSADGKKILWIWWATKNGYPTDFFGKKRDLDINKDHRLITYDTWLHTTHVNSAVELEDGSILCAFFQQGILGRIDRITGQVTTIVSDLKRPHAVRMCNDRYITFADTGRGIAYRGIFVGQEFKLESSVRLSTSWLQDCQYVNDHWILVDGSNSSVYIIDKNGKIIVRDQFDPKWYLYEATPYEDIDF